MRAAGSGDLFGVGGEHLPNLLRLCRSNKI
jgi:hypothetical protein